jgi:hypothetical protein
MELDDELSLRLLTEKEGGGGEGVDDPQDDVGERMLAMRDRVRGPENLAAAISRARSWAAECGWGGGRPVAQVQRSAAPTDGEITGRAKALWTSIVDVHIEFQGVDGRRMQLGDFGDPPSAFTVWESEAGCWVQIAYISSGMNGDAELEAARAITAEGLRQEDYPE